MMEREGINRLVVIDHRKDGRGVVVEAWRVKVTETVQDEGRTLKIFITEKDEPK